MSQKNPKNLAYFHYFGIFLENAKGVQQAIRQQ
jgi:hypothetical protein